MVFTIVVLVILLSNIFIIIEDFKAREVRVFWYFLTLLGVTILIFSEFGIIASLINVSNNLILLIIQFLLIQVYFLIKGLPIGGIKSLIGTGDVFFLFICCIAFPIRNLLIFIIIGSILSLILNYFLWRKKDLKIPFAGVLAICFFLMISIGIVCNKPFWFYKTYSFEF